MATRAALTVYTEVSTGTSPVFTAGVVADGHKFVNDGQTVAILKNSNAATRTVIFQTPATADGQAIAEGTYVIPGSGDGGMMIAGPFSPGIFNQATGEIYVDYPAGNEADCSIHLSRVIRKI